MSETNSLNVTNNVNAAPPATTGAVTSTVKPQLEGIIDETGKYLHRSVYQVTRELLVKFMNKITNSWQSMTFNDFDTEIKKMEKHIKGCRQPIDELLNKLKDTNNQTTISQNANPEKSSEIELKLGQLQKELNDLDVEISNTKTKQNEILRESGKFDKLLETNSMVETTIEILKSWAKKNSGKTLEGNDRKEIYDQIRKGSKNSDQLKLNQIFDKIEKTKTPVDTSLLERNQWTDVCAEIVPGKKQEIESKLLNANKTLENLKTKREQLMLEITNLGSNHIEAKNAVLEKNLLMCGENEEQKRLILENESKLFRVWNLISKGRLFKFLSRDKSLFKNNFYKTKPIYPKDGRFTSLYLDKLEKELAKRMKGSKIFRPVSKITAKIVALYRSTLGKMKRFKKNYREKDAKLGTCIKKWEALEKSLFSYPAQVWLNFLAKPEDKIMSVPEIVEQRQNNCNTKFRFDSEGMKGDPNKLVEALIAMNLYSQDSVNFPLLKFEKNKIVISPRWKNEGKLNKHKNDKMQIKESFGLDLNIEEKATNAWRAL